MTLEVILFTVNLVLAQMPVPCVQSLSFVLVTLSLSFHSFKRVITLHQARMEILTVLPHE